MEKIRKIQVSDGKEIELRRMDDGTLVEAEDLFRNFEGEIECLLHNLERVKQRWLTDQYGIKQAVKDRLGNIMILRKHGINNRIVDVVIDRDVARPARTDD